MTCFLKIFSNRGMDKQSLIDNMGYYINANRQKNMGKRDIDTKQIIKNKISNQINSEKYMP